MYIYFPISWPTSDGLGGPPVEDAGTIYIVRELIPEDWPDEIYKPTELANKTSLTEIMAQRIKAWKAMNDR